MHTSSSKMLFGALVLSLLGSVTTAFASTESLELAVGELQVASSERNARHQRVIASPDQYYSRWLVSGGAGINLDPGAFLLMAQLEYVDRPWLFYGPFVEMIFPGNSVVFTGGATVRTTMGHGLIRPSVEAGAGLTFASGGGSSLGFHFHFGIGAEYHLKPGIVIATMFKPTFTPGIDNFWLSWPILIGRFAL